MRRAFLAVLAAAMPCIVSAQVKYESPTGPVEIFGLRRWTLSMLRDSLRKYAPGLELHESACMVVLRDSLHFADALVTTMVGFDRDAPTKEYRVIKVVEPADRARVRWDDRPREQYWVVRPPYAPLFAGLTDSSGLFLPGHMFWLQFRDSADRAQALANAPERRRPYGERIYAFLNDKRKESDRALALKVLEEDGYVINRIAALAVLGNFLDNDSTYYAIVRALRDRDERVRAAAALALTRIPERRIDWTPVVTDLRLLLGGTNVSAISSVMQLLTMTKVEPSLARPLLRGNAALVLEHLGSAVESAWARGLLQQLNGGKTYATRAEWSAWARRL